MRNLKTLTALRRFAAAESGMALLEYGLLSAVIGLVLFGSAMALGFQASTSFTAIATSIDTQPFPDRAASKASQRPAGSGVVARTLPGPPALRESTGGAPQGQEYASSGGAWSGIDRMLDRAPGKTAKKARKAGGGVSVAALGGAGAGSIASPGAGPRYAGAPAAPAGSDFALPIGRPAQGQRLAFESSRSAQEADSGANEILLDYPIPPRLTNAELEAAEDPLVLASLAVAHGERSKEVGKVGKVYAAFTGEGVSAPTVEGSDMGMWAGAAVRSLGLSDQDVMLLSMVVGLLSIAIFLWLASWWLTDRTTIRRQKIWERQQAQALELGADCIDETMLEEKAAA